jgi:hypothetical protein
MARNRPGTRSSADSGASAGSGASADSGASAGVGASVSATAYWHPAGVLGLLYWYVLVPPHLFIFKGLTRALVRRAAR